MDALLAGLRYLVDNWFSESTSLDSISRLFVEHVVLTVVSLAIATAIGLPVGILLSRHERSRGPVLGVLGVVYTIPSLALLVVLIMLFGIGTTPAVIALVAYSQLVIVRNTVVGLEGIDPAVLEAAVGMGMNGRQRLLRVELPLAAPMILAGIRLATISIIGIGTVAAYINAGGLGKLLFTGLISGNQARIIAGAVAISALAIGANTLIRMVERRVARGVGAE